MEYKIVIAYVVLLSVSSTSWGHHASIGLYDNKVEDTLEGSISSIFWRNPHVRIGILRVGEGGEEEEWDGVRVFYMGNHQPEAIEYPRMGYSTGRWDGDTLVVKTSNIDWPYIDDLGSPMSDDVVITEYFSLSDEGIQLDYEAHINDPAYYSEPIIMNITWVWVPGHEIKPFNCSLTD